MNTYTACSIIEGFDGEERKKYEEIKAGIIENQSPAFDDSKYQDKIVITRVSR